MIEMLGVLAIIGVLSAGGIMGYSMAMENYKVSKTIDMLTLGQTSVPNLTSGRFQNGSQGIRADQLCQNNILPTDICKKGTGIYRKGYFDEKIDPRIWIMGATSHFEIYFFTYLPFSSCVKIMTHEIWKKYSSSSLYVYNLDKNFNLPLPLSTAKDICKKDTLSGYAYRIITGTE